MYFDRASPTRMIAVLRALLVERDPGLRALMRTVLEGEGIECVEAEDGIEALMFASEGGIDLIIADLDLPRLGGLSLLALISQGAFGANPPPTIVCSTHLDDEQYAHRPELAFAVARIAKPFRADQLIEAIASAFPEP